MKQVRSRVGDVDAAGTGDCVEREDAMPVDCEKIIYSEEYEDYIIEYFGQGEEVREIYRTPCYQLLTSRLGVAYQKATDVMEAERNSLLIIPRCFGLLSSTQLMEESGIARVQRQPNLSLYGSGVLFGIVDTGAGVRIAPL